MKKFEQEKGKMSKTLAYWILGIIGIGMVCAWSYFDPGDRVFFDDAAKKAKMEKAEKPDSISAVPEKRPS